MSKKIIIFIGVLFIASFIHLAYSSEKILDPNTDKNWWLVYFEEPTSANLNFIIANHSDEEDFYYEVFQKEILLYSEEVSVKKSATLRLSVEEKIPTEKKGRLSIRIFNKNESREIYKNF